MAPMSLTTKSQQLTVVGKPVRTGLWPALQNGPLPLSLLCPVCSSLSGHLTISLAPQMSSPSGSWHLLLPLPGSIPYVLENTNTSERPSQLSVLLGFSPRPHQPPAQGDPVVADSCQSVWFSRRENVSSTRETPDFVPCHVPTCGRVPGTQCML